MRKVNNGGVASGVSEIYGGLEYNGNIKLDGQWYRFAYNVVDGYLDGCICIDSLNKDGSVDVDTDVSDQTYDRIGAIVEAKVARDGVFRMRDDLDGTLSRLDNIRMVAKHSSELMEHKESIAKDELYRILQVISHFSNTNEGVESGGFIGSSEMGDHSWCDLDLTSIADL